MSWQKSKNTGYKTKVFKTQVYTTQVYKVQKYIKMHNKINLPNKSELFCERESPHQHHMTKTPKF